MIKMAVDKYAKQKHIRDILVSVGFLILLIGIIISLPELGLKIIGGGMFILISGVIYWIFSIPIEED